MIFALLLAGLPAAAYADESGGAIGAIVRAPGEAAAGIIGGLTGTEAPRFHHYVVEETRPVLHLGGTSARRSLATFCRPRAWCFIRFRVNTVSRNYQYTVVDNTPVLVDPATRRIVEVVP